MKPLFVSGSFFYRRCLINKRTFSYHFLCAWAATPTFVIRLSCTLSSLGCTGVIWVSLLGCNQASHSQWSESHWTRQKCSASSCQYTPTPAICRRAFSPLTPAFPPPPPLPSPPFRCLFRLSATPGTLT